MNTGRTEILLIVLGLVLTVVSVVFGAWDVAWNLLGTPDVLRTPLSNAASVVFLLFSFLVVFWMELKKIHARVERIAIPHPPMDVLPGDEAFAELIKRVPSATGILNTKLYAGEAQPAPNAEYPKPAMEDWHKALKARLKGGGLVLRDVVSPGWIQAVTDIRAASKARGAKGTYQAAIVESGHTPLLNFTVVTTKEGDEVWFGWMITPGNPLSEQCCRSRDPRLVDLFKRWHRELFTAGKKLQGGTDG